MSESTLNRNKKVEFINFLRIFAAFIVLFSHIGFMFYCGGVDSNIIYLNPVNGTAPFLMLLYDLLNKVGVSFGHFGVAIFFLISGFCTFISCERKSFVSFWKSRIIKLYPTYIIAFSITFLNIFLYTSFFDKTFPYTIKDWLIQISLLRDWLWNQSVDGLSWTLEVQLKLYFVLSVVFYFGIRSCKNTDLNDFKIKTSRISKTIFALQVLFIILYRVCFIILSNLDYSFNLYPYAIFYVLCFNIPLISYGMIGTSVYLHYRGGISNRQLILHIIIGTISYCISFCTGIYNTGAKSRIVSYSLGLIVFLLAYLFPIKAISKAKIVKWGSDISYALYAVQGSCYLIMSVIDMQRINPYLNILITGIILVIYALVVTRISGLVSRKMR